MRLKWISWIWLKYLALGLLIFPLSYLSFKFLSDSAWVIILLACLSYLIFLGLRTRKVSLKILFFNLSAVFIALFIYESYLWISNLSSTRGKSIQKEGTYVTGKYWAPHPFLGYGPRTDGVFTSKKSVNHQVIYDVSYTIKDGLRYTPGSNEKSPNCVLFFGCSYTFGEGLADTSTLPFYFNRFEDQKYRVINYGFHGYGPHQMLANVENRVAADLQGCGGEKIAIYSFASFHIERTAGRATWDQDGPRYEIINDSLMKVGNFTDWPKKLGIISKSHIFKRLYFERKSSHYDLARTVEIIKRSNELLLSQNVILYVFFWDYPRLTENDYFLNEMKKNNINILFLHDAIPDFGKHRSTFTLNENDVHPNGLANEEIAKYLHLKLSENKQTIN